MLRFGDATIAANLDRAMYPSSPTKNPLGSWAWKIIASCKPGFHPSSVAHTMQTFSLRYFLKEPRSFSSHITVCVCVFLCECVSVWVCESTCVCGDVSEVMQQQLRWAQRFGVPLLLLWPSLSECTTCQMPYRPWISTRQSFSNLADYTLEVDTERLV